jgi:type I restriction enzyme M protein
MEAMILVGNSNKSKDRKGKVLFINANEDYVDNKGQAHLKNEHIEKIYKAYKDYSNIKNYAKVVANEDILANRGNLNISVYVKSENGENSIPLDEALEQWSKSSKSLNLSMSELFKQLENG